MYNTSVRIPAVRNTLEFFVKLKSPSYKTIKVTFLLWRKETRCFNVRALFNVRNADEWDYRGHRDLRLLYSVYNIIYYK